MEYAHRLCTGDPKAHCAANAHAVASFATLPGVGAQSQLKGKVHGILHSNQIIGSETPENSGHRKTGIVLGQSRTMENPDAPSDVQNAPLFTLQANAFHPSDFRISSHAIFLNRQIIFLSSQNELHDRLLPHLRSWGLNVSAHSGPTGIGLEFIKKAHAIIFCGPRDAWSPKDENRVTAAAACVIECDSSHSADPIKINNRFITVSSHSLHGIFRALQWAMDASGTLLEPFSSAAAHAGLGDGVFRLKNAPASIRNAFLDSVSSSLHVIQVSRSGKAVMMELHNLSGSLRFFQLTDLSIRCTHLEEYIHRDGLNAHAADLALLTSTLKNMMKSIDLNGEI